MLSQKAGKLTFLFWIQYIFYVVMQQIFSLSFTVAWPAFRHVYKIYSYLSSINSFQRLLSNKQENIWFFRNHLMGKWGTQNTSKYAIIWPQISYFASMFAPSLRTKAMLPVVIFSTDTFSNKELFEPVSVWSEKFSVEQITTGSMAFGISKYNQWHTL